MGTVDGLLKPLGTREQALGTLKLLLAQ
jgi:hypothetical protein